MLYDNILLCYGEHVTWNLDRLLKPGTAELGEDICLCGSVAPAVGAAAMDSEET